MEIIPAILPRNFREIEEKVALLDGLVKTIQIDICDGKFVPSTTWPYKNFGSNGVATLVAEDRFLKEILDEKRGLPNWDNVDFEFDLMISNPTEKDAVMWLKTGATRIIFHAESSDDLSPAIKVLDGLAEVGLALNVTTSNDVIDGAIATGIKFVQLMGIRKIGYQGQEFDDRVIEKVKEVRAKYPDLPIQIDGGVDFDNALALKDAGATRLVVGSALFDNPDIAEAYRGFVQVVR